VRAVLHDAAFVQHDNLVRVHQALHAVRDDKRGAPLHQRLQRAPDLASVSMSTDEVESSRIRMRGFLSRVRAIATRCFCPPESVTPLADQRVVAVGEGHDRVVDGGSFGGRNDFLIRDLPVHPERDVFADRRENRNGSCSTMPIWLRR
jgi:hypothetical protein